MRFWAIVAFSIESFQNRWSHNLSLQHWLSESLINIWVSMQLSTSSIRETKYRLWIYVCNSIKINALLSYYHNWYTIYIHLKSLPILACRFLNQINVNNIPMSFSWSSIFIKILNTCVSIRDLCKPSTTHLAHVTLF